MPFYSYVSNLFVQAPSILLSYPPLFPHEQDNKNAINSSHWYTSLWEQCPMKLDPTLLQSHLAAVAILYPTLAPSHSILARSLLIVLR